jgi:L-serine dehydratase
MGGEIGEVLVEFHPDGSLATTHESQGSDMGLFGGLLGWEATDERLVDSARAIQEAGILVETRISEFPALHPNTYRITLKKDETVHRMVALSTGGGIIQVIEIDGVALDISGDFHETLIFPPAPESGGVERTGKAREKDWSLEELLEELSEAVDSDDLLAHSGGGVSILQIKSQGFPPPELIRSLSPGLRKAEIRTLSPVLPIRSRKGMTVPFVTARDFLAVLEPSTPLWRYATRFEASRGGISEEEVLSRMEEIIVIMEGSVREGLAGTRYGDRILPPQTGSFQAHLNQGDLLDAGVLNRMILYTSAIMEVKSSMGVVVAAPTAGSCGALPAAVLGAGHTLGSTREELAKAMLAAGLIGVFITSGSTFAAEVCGCQAECGAGSGMAAAGLVSLMGGSTDQGLTAASMALQNTLGLICDPVANRVEVPCLGRNVLAAGNALSCANMALAGFDGVIPLDEVIDAMDEVGKSLPRQLRCTALGGLSVTETSRRIEDALGGV